MALSVPYLTPIEESWGENLHRLLERVASVDIEDASEPNVATLEDDKPSFSGERSQPTSVALDSSEPLPTDNIPPTGVSRALPALPTSDRLPTIASAFDIYIEPDLPTPPRPSREKHRVWESEPKVRLEEKPVMRVRSAQPSNALQASSFDPAIVSYESTDGSASDSSPRQAAIRLNMHVKSSFDPHEPPNALSAQQSTRTSSIGAPPDVTVTSAHEDLASQRATSLLSSTSSCPESIRSQRSGPPIISVHTPTLTPQPLRLDTNYVRPHSHEEVSKRTPFVEVGPPVDAHGISKSPPPPYRTPSPGHQHGNATESPTRRRMNSFYALSDARGDQMLKDPPQSAATQPISPGTRRGHQSHSDFHILPEDHTGRTRERKELPMMPTRKPVPPQVNVTDTFKETLVRSNREPRHDSLKEVVMSSPIPQRPASNSYALSTSNEDLGRKYSVDRNRVNSFHGGIPQRLSASQSRESYSSLEVPQRPHSAQHYDQSYPEVTKDLMMSGALLEPPLAVDAEIPSSTEPQSRVEMIRKKNMERKLATKRQLRVVNA